MYYQDVNKIMLTLILLTLLYPDLMKHVSSQAVPITYPLVIDSNGEEQCLGHNELRMQHGIVPGGEDTHGDLHVVIPDTVDEVAASTQENAPTFVSHNEVRIEHGILTDSEDTHSDAIIPENIVVNTVAQSNDEVSTTRISHNDVRMQHNIIAPRGENTHREETIPYSREELPQVDDAVHSLPTPSDASGVSAWMCDIQTPVQSPNMMHTDLPEQCYTQSLTPSFSNTESDDHSTGIEPESPNYQNVTQTHGEPLQSIQHDTLSIPESTAVIRQVSYETSLDTYIPTSTRQEQEYTSYQSVAGELPRPPETSSHRTPLVADPATQASTKRSTLTVSDATTANHQTMSVSSTSHQQTGAVDDNEDVQAIRAVHTLEWQQVRADSATATSYCAVREPQQPVDHTPHHTAVDHDEDTLTSEVNTQDVDAGQRARKEVQEQKGDQPTATSCTINARGSTL